MVDLQRLFWPFFLPPTWTTLSVGSLGLNDTSPAHLQFLFHMDCDSLLVIASYLCIGPETGQRWLSLRCWTTDPKRGASALKRCSRAKNMACLVVWEVFLSRGDVQKCATTWSTHGGGEFWGALFLGDELKVQKFGSLSL